MSKVNFIWYTRSQHSRTMDLADDKERGWIIQALRLPKDTTEQGVQQALDSVTYAMEKKIGEMLDEFNSGAYWVYTDPTDDVDWELED